MGFQDDLTAAATEELDRAMSLGWAQLSKHTPWGDTFEGFTPEGREVCFERAYMWEGGSGGDIRVEVSVYEPRAFEDGVRLTRMITKDGSDG
ncbi:MAG: hypothetical protein A2790_20340 [Phenylobacterium sp. RIFCSPHIGHO2_01_FULL_69_31]|uniref:hypothetical protein n=1 Tax=Phenylobacterium sp. RIFCSPHIGHO2_01_FULL_69_31 TaxID=1801944 RepID=UPI0008C4F175|nr:hypothetical protein [Phenylobacterium sp. RIFCSPHIGHO2_01_FULL_69_31]OHB26310.1 MAG: hypothetical protein A2790_20340 [Phenylobacterium sp. RIFCSPHIGHO2_01_FULL_69_31]